MSEKPGVDVGRRIPRAQLLAFLALNGSEVQQPSNIVIREYRYQGRTYRIVDLEVDDEVSLRHWCDQFSSDRDITTDPPHTDGDGDSWTYYRASATWRGFRVSLVAKVPDVTTKASGLDEASRGELIGLVDDRAVAE